MAGPVRMSGMSQDSPVRPTDDGLPLAGGITAAAEDAAIEPNKPDGVNASGISQAAARFGDSAAAYGVTPQKNILSALDPAASYDERIANLWGSGFSFTDEEIEALKILTPLLGVVAIRDVLDEFLESFSDWRFFPTGAVYTELADGQKIVMPNAETLRALRGLVELAAALPYQQSDNVTLEVLARLGRILPSNEELMAIEMSVAVPLLSESSASAEDRGVTLTWGEVRFLQDTLVDISRSYAGSLPEDIQRTLISAQTFLEAHPDGTPLALQGPATIIGTGVQIGGSVEMGGETIYPLYVAISAVLALAYVEDIYIDYSRLERLEAVRAGLEALLGGEQSAGRVALDQALRPLRGSTYDSRAAWRQFLTDAQTGSEDNVARMLFAVATQRGVGLRADDRVPQDLRDPEVRQFAADILRDERELVEDRVNAVVRFVSFARPDVGRGEVLSGLRDGVLLGAHVQARDSRAWQDASCTLFDTHLAAVVAGYATDRPGWMLLVSLDPTLGEDVRRDLTVRAGLVWTQQDLNRLAQYNEDLDRLAQYNEDLLDLESNAVSSFFTSFSGSASTTVSDGCKVVVPEWEDLQGLRRLVDDFIGADPSDKFWTDAETDRLLRRLDGILPSREALERADPRRQSGRTSTPRVSSYLDDKTDFTIYSGYLTPYSGVAERLSNFSTLDSKRGEPSASAVGTIWTGLQTFLPESSGEIRLEPDGNTVRLVRTAPAAKPANNGYGHLIYRLTPESLESRLQVAQDQEFALGGTSALRELLMQLGRAADANDAASGAVLRQLLSENREAWRDGFAALASRREANKAPIGTLGAYGATATGARLQLWTSRGASAVPVGR